MKYDLSKKIFYILICFIILGFFITYSQAATEEEIEASPNNDCQDLEYDDCDYINELCLLTFIPTNKVIEPKILVTPSKS